ncbi:MAG: hypothetical protein WD873_01160, partial [Candidatus Hydrogenedentales bacterium]
MATVSVIGGLGASDRASAVDDLFLAHWGRARLIVPTHQAAEHRTQALIRAGKIRGVWGRPIGTFDSFVSDLLRGTRHEGRALRPLEERLLLHRAVDHVRAAGLLESIGNAAQTAGFLNHMRRIIGQLKQAAVEPAAFQERVRQRRQPMDAVVGAVYEQYQRLLQERRVYDTQGRYWAAQLLCTEQKPPLLDSLDAIVLDGFDDFTRSEFRLIESLALHVGHLVVGVHFDERPERNDLFDATRGLINRLKEKLDAAVDGMEPHAPANAGAYVGLNVFSRETPPEPRVDLEANVDLYAGHTPTQELEHVARRIKRLVLEQHVPLDDIAVVCRNLQPCAAKIQHLFDSYGIPVRLPFGTPLWESGLAAAILRLYDALGDWSREAVVEVAAAPCFTGGNRSLDKLRPLYGLVARMAQVTQGRREWRHQLRRLHRRLCDAPEKDREALHWRKRMPLAADACEALIVELDRLDAAQDTLPQTAAIGEHAKTLLQLLDTWDVPAAIQQMAPATAAFELESAAYQAVREILQAFKAWGGEQRIDRADFLGHLRDALQQTRLPAPSVESGVAVLDMNAARHLPFDHVFLIQAVDGQLPQSPATTALYNDRDLRDLIRCDIPLETADLAVARELVLFQRLFDQPHGRIHLSWHEMSSKGQATRPSAFVADVCRLLPNAPASRCANPLDAAAPELDAAAKWRELQNAAYAREYVRAGDGAHTLPHVALAAP